MAAVLGSSAALENETRAGLLKDLEPVVYVGTRCHVVAGWWKKGGLKERRCVGEGWCCPIPPHRHWAVCDVITSHPTRACRAEIGVYAMAAVVVYVALVAVLCDCLRVLRWVRWASVIIFDLSIV